MFAQLFVWVVKSHRRDVKSILCRLLVLLAFAVLLSLLVSIAFFFVFEVTLSPVLSTLARLDWSTVGWLYLALKFHSVRCRDFVLSRHRLHGAMLLVNNLSVLIKFPWAFVFLEGSHLLSHRLCK